MHIALTHVNIYIPKSLKPLPVAVFRAANRDMPNQKILHQQQKTKRNSKFWTMDKYDPLGTYPYNEFQKNANTIVKLLISEKYKYLFPFCFHLFICQSEFFLSIFLCPHKELHEDCKSG